MVDKDSDPERAGRARQKNLRPEPAPGRDLSPTDMMIIEILRRNARMPNNAIAAAVGVAPSTCLGRVRELERRGVIRGYHADIDLQAVGTPLEAMVAVRLRPGARHRLREFTDEIARSPEVLNVFFLAGGDDFLIHVALADTQAMRDFVLDQLSARREVATTQTNIIFEHVRGTARE